MIAPDKRLRVLVITQDELYAMIATLFTVSRGGVTFRTFAPGHELPKDSQLVDVHYDWQRVAWCLVIWSTEYEHVKEGEFIPVILRRNATWREVEVKLPTAGEHHPQMTAQTGLSPCYLDAAGRTIDMSKATVEGMESSPEDTILWVEKPAPKPTEPE